MREFYELIGRRDAVDPGIEHVLRSGSLTILQDTAKFWLKAGLVNYIEVFHVRDACQGKEEGRVKMLTTGRISGGGWFTTNADGVDLDAWKLD